MQLFYLLFTIFIVQCLAETKWVWERNYNSDPFGTRRNDYKRESLPYRYPSEYLQYDRDRLRELERIRDIERQRERDRERERDRDRNRDREPITVRPSYNRPSEPEDFDEYDIDDQYNRPNYDSRPYTLPPRPLPPRPLPPIQNFRPNNQGGFLIGPGGPVGVIGRPNGIFGSGSNRLPLTNGIQNPNGIHPNDLRPNAANGVLVGPGGPTGVIGRPQYGNGGYIGAPGGIGGAGGNIGAGNGYPPIGPNGIGSNSFGPQVFSPLPPGIQPGSLNGIRQPGNPTGNVYPNYGYSSGSSGIGGVGGGGAPYGNGNIYPGQYPNTAGQQAQQQGQYGFYPSQYYPIGPYGQNNGNRLPYPYPYNNELGNDNQNNNGYYAPGYDEFARSASSASKTKDKDKDSIKFEDRKVKKSIVDDKLADIQ